MMILPALLLMTSAQREAVALPAPWREVAEQLDNRTGWVWECPNQATPVPGPALPLTGGMLRWADMLADRLGRGVVINQTGKTIRLVSLPKGGRWIAAHSGSFRLVALRAIRTDDFSNPVGGIRRELLVELSWESATEPILVPAVWEKVGIKVTGKPVVSAIAARALVEPMATQRQELVTMLSDTQGASLPEGWSATLQGRAILPSGLIDLNLGTYPAVLGALRGGPLEVARKGQFACILLGVTRNGRRVSLRVRVERDPVGPGLESFQSWIVLNRLRLVDLVGGELTPIGQVLEREDDHAAEVTYHVLLPEGTENRPREIRYRTLTGLREESLHFDLAGLPAIP